MNRKWRNATAGSHSKGGRTAARASDPWERPLDLAGEEGDTDSPVSIPSTRSTCEPHECSRCSASTAAGPAPRGTLARAPSTKRALRERSARSRRRSQCGSRLPWESTLRASLPNRPHTDCVYPQQKCVCREEHTACSVIHSRFFQVLIECLCIGQTTLNKTHNRERQTHTE